MKKLLFAAMLAIAPLPAIAQEECVTVETFIAAAGEYTHASLTGDELANYIDAFNAVTSGKQDKVSFDRIEVFFLDEKNVGWTFFEDGCLINSNVIPRKLHDAIIKKMNESI